MTNDRNSKRERYFWFIGLQLFIFLGLCVWTARRANVGAMIQRSINSAFDNSEVFETLAEDFLNENNISHAQSSLIMPEVPFGDILVPYHYYYMFQAKEADIQRLVSNKKYRWDERVKKVYRDSVKAGKAGQPSPYCKPIDDLRGKPINLNDDAVKVYSTTHDINLGLTDNEVVLFWNKKTGYACLVVVQGDW